jgi:two-component system, NtrC family, sensor kinase
MASREQRTSEHDRLPYGRLHRQTVAALLAFGLIPLIAMAIVGLVAIRETGELRARNSLESMIKNRKVTIDFFLEETMRQLSLFASTLPVSQLSQPAVLTTLTEQARRERSPFVDLGLISDQGEHVAYVGPYRLQSMNYANEPWFHQVMMRGQYASDVFLGFRRFPHMIMAVKKREEGRDWILRATIDIDVLSALAREGGLESGARVFILDRAGEYQTSDGDEHALMEQADIGPVPLHSGVRLTARASRGHQEYLATAWLRGDQWVLVARQPRPDLSMLLLAHPTAALALALGLLLVPPLSVLVARRRLCELRRLEQERAALYASVAQTQKMATIGRLATGVAHEINNPLAIIRAQVAVLADLLADSPEMPHTAELRERVAKIEAQVERGGKVTHGLLRFSRRVGPEVEAVDVATAIDETLGFLEKGTEAMNIRLVREYDPNAPIIRSNLAQIQQVLLNLINNAIDAVGSGGEIRFSVKGSRQGVAVEVADDGPGIPAQDLRQIFEPFFSTKADSEHPHTGLGLAICQEIMCQLGGSIAVSSEPGAGTTFELWLPGEPEQP